MGDGREVRNNATLAAALREFSEEVRNDDGRPYFFGK
jgi:hypothetical protein